MPHSTQASHSLYVREGPCPGILSHCCAAKFHSHVLNTLHVRQHLNARMLLFPDPEHSRLCGRLCAPPSHLQRTTPHCCCCSILSIAIWPNKLLLGYLQKQGKC